MTYSPLQTLTTILQDIITNTRGVDVSELRNCQQFVSTEQRVNILRTTVRGSGTALHFAVLAHDTNTIQCLLDGTSDRQRVELLKIQNEQGYTAIHLAANKGHTDTIKCLLDGIPIVQKLELLKLQDDDGNTPVHNAAAEGHTDIIKCVLNCLSLKQQAELLNIVTFNDETALKVAVKHNRLKVADYLKLQLMSSHSTLPPSSESHSSTADNCLLNVNASPQTNKRSADTESAPPTSPPKIKLQKYHTMTSSQQTLEKLLNDAIDYKQLDIAELRSCLLSVSGDQRFHSLTNVVCDVSKDTALHKAAEKGYTDTIKRLLGGLPEDQLLDLLKIQNEVGDTALHRASLHGHKDIIKHIMDLLKPEQKTELLDICNNSNETALKIARRESKEDAAGYLKECGREATKTVNQQLEMVVYLQNLQLEEYKRKMQEREQCQDPASNTSSDAHGEVDESVNGKILGKGAHGKVYGQFDKQTKRMVAIKKVDLGPILSGDITKEVKTLCKEIGLMKDFSHKRIVQYIRAETESNMLCIYMEYMAGRSVKDQLVIHGPFSEFLTQTYTRQILEGLSYLHGKGIIHRDVKGQNILCDGKGNIKLADFGISKELLNIQTLTGHTNANTNKVGTAHFMAPEIVNSTDYGEKADVWSTGATIVEMLTAHPPWYTFEALLAIYRIGKGDYPVYILNPETSANAKSFLDLTFKSKEDRPTADELLQNRWLVKLPATNGLLGAGSYGRVYLQFDSQTNRMLAVKKTGIDPDSQGYLSKEMHALCNEASLMKVLDHGRIVQHIRVETESNEMCILMEYMAGGSLRDHLENRGSFNENQTQIYTRQILEGLSYLHGKHIMHRNVKGSNVLCDGNGNIKLGGFRLSKQQDLMLETGINETAGVGTIYWMAPEVIIGDNYGRRVDIWSTGATVVEMLTTHPPWHHLDHVVAMFKIGTLKTAHYVLDPSISGDAENFLALTFKPEEQRPEAEELLQHPWLKMPQTTA